MGAREVYTEFWWGKLMERDHLEDLEVDCIMLQWISRSWDRKVRIGLIWLRTGRVGGLVKAVMKFRVPKKCRIFLDWLRTC
jgi:hypothetical protein